MKKIKKIIIGTHNQGKFREISYLLPKNIVKISPKKLNLCSPKEIGKNFQDNSKIKAKYFSRKTNLICIADDSGFLVDDLNGEPGIFSSRWAGKSGNFNLAIEKVYRKLKKKRKKKFFFAKFICCLTVCWPSGKFVHSVGFVRGKISEKKKGKNGFGYDPIFIPKGYKKTFGEMKPNFKIKIDHRFKAFSKIKKLF